MINSSISSGSGSPQVVEPTEKIALFNGDNLDGWTSDIPARDTDPDAPDIVEVKNGVIVTPGVSVGHLISNQAFRNYRLEVEYRLPPIGGGGSVLIHVSKLRVLRTKSKNIFPQSLDIKIRHKDAGDIYCIEENIDCSDSDRRPCEPGQVPGGSAENARHIIKLKDAEAPVGDWNTMVVESRGRDIQIWLNGTLVNEGSNCTTDHGKVALQATEQPVEFRRVEILPLR
jgi:hypothetical protein